MADKSKSFWKNHRVAIIFAGFTLLLVIMLIYFLVRLNSIL